MSVGRKGAGLLVLRLTVLCGERDFSVYPLLRVTNREVQQ